MRGISFTFFVFCAFGCRPNFVDVEYVSTPSTAPLDSGELDSGVVEEPSDEWSAVDDESLDLLERLEAIEGMSVQTLTTEHPGRHFKLIYRQPISHNDPDAGEFEQHILLHHFDLNSPMVLATTGYHNYVEDHLFELTAVYGANQLTVEQRFFGESVPNVSDWSALTIENAAADHHRIVNQLKRIYHSNWVSTGHSKGGMTSVYHRRFYPDDVDATVAYVAPISFGAPDDRYPLFFEEVIDQACKSKIRAFQNEALDRWDQLYPMFLEQSTPMNNSYTIAGGPKPAFEDLISGFEWFFWQYLGMTYCEYVPDQNGADEVFMEILGWQGFDNGADHRIVPFRPYYYQAYTQLGFPAGPSHLRDRLNHPYQGSVLPNNVGSFSYQPEAMTDIDHWVRSEGERILFVYGEYDPWTAGAFGIGGADQHVFVLPEGAHGTQISDLPFAEAELAFEIVGDWLALDRVRRLTLPVLPPPRMTHRPLFLRQ